MELSEAYNYFCVCTAIFILYQKYVYLFVDLYAIRLVIMAEGKCVTRFKGVGMKKISKLALSLAAASSVFTAKPDGAAIARSYFVVRPSFQLVMPERESFWRNDRMTEREDGYDGTFEAVVFGGQSTNPRTMAQYFLPYEACSLVFREYGNEVANDPNWDTLNRSTFNIDASNFNIQTVAGNFQSTVTFRPKQSYVGAGFGWKQLLTRKCDGTPGFWLEASMPIINIRNTMGMCEVITSTGGGAANAVGLDGAPVVGSATAAFKQPSWKFGRIDNNSSCMQKTGVAELSVLIGYNTVNHEHSSLSSYVGVVIPTSNKPTGRYLFEPIVGNGGHAGIMFGANLGFDVWQCDQHNLAISLSTNSRYLFANNQVRSFDLYDNQWSRYLMMYANSGAAEAAFAGGEGADNQLVGAVSGINYMTKCVKVIPRFWFDMNSAVTYTNSDCPWMAEAGWNFFARQAEKVCLPKWTVNPAVVGGPLGNGGTTIARTIRYEFANANLAYSETNYAATQIKKADINLESAAAPAALSYIVYGSVGYNWGTKCYPTFAGIGGSYEFTANTAAINRWNLWGKLGFSY